MKEYLELVEEFNEKGVCIRRTINGCELPPDTEPSVVIFKNLKNVVQKKYMTPEEVKNRYS